MRALLPGPVDDVDVHAYYAAGWLDRGGLRVNLVSSVDGAAQSGGVSAGLQTPGDNLVFGALRDLADVVVAGAGTVRAEGYGAIRVSTRGADLRRRYGLRPQLPTAILSRSLRLDPTAALFTETAADARTLVLTCAAADAEARRLLRAVADVVDCGDETVDSALARAALEDRGHTRILCEGGPHAFTDLVQDGVVDELCMSLTPRLIGPGPSRITAGPDWTDSRPLTLAGLLEEDGALFARYLVGPV